MLCRDGWYRDNVKTSTDTLNPAPRRRATATGTLVGTRFQSDLLDAIDTWRKGQADLPTRPEAVRRLVELGMAVNATNLGKQSENKRRNSQF